jgi:hypothetical protein
MGLAVIAFRRRDGVGNGPGLGYRDTVRMQHLQRQGMDLIERQSG